MLRSTTSLPGRKSARRQFNARDALDTTSGSSLTEIGKTDGIAAVLFVRGKTALMSAGLIAGLVAPAVVIVSLALVPLASANPPRMSLAQAKRAFCARAVYLVRTRYHLRIDQLGPSKTNGADADCTLDYVLGVIRVSETGASLPLVVSRDKKPCRFRVEGTLHWINVNPTGTFQSVAFGVTCAQLRAKLPPQSPLLAVVTAAVCAQAAARVQERYQITISPKYQTPKSCGFTFPAPKTAGLQPFYAVNVARDGVNPCLFQVETLVIAWPKLVPPQAPPLPNESYSVTCASLGLPG